MKPLIIIPDANQKTITMTIEDFKKTISDVWDQGYKEGQIAEKVTEKSYPTILQNDNWWEKVTLDGTGNGYYPGSISTTTTLLNSEQAKNKRTFDKGSAISKDSESNVW